MKITPVSGAGAIPVNGTPEAQRTAKAVAAFNKGASSYDKQSASAQSQTSGAPPVNQNAVSVEDLSAIQPPQQDMAEAQEAQGEEQAPEVEQPAKPAEDPALSRQFAQLARQERALNAKRQQQEQQWKAKEADLAAREAALQPSKPDMSNYVSVDQLKRDAFGTLSKLGVTYDEYSQQAMNHQPVNPVIESTINDLKAQIEELKASNQTSQKTYQDQQQAQYQAAVQQIKMDVQSLVKSDPQTYEVIAKSGRGAIDEVVKLIEQTYAKDKVLMTVEEAAQEVEDYMTEQSYKTLSQIDKIKKRMAEANASSKPSDVKTQSPPKQQQPMKTLTNATGSTRQLTVRERAIAAMEGRLK